MPLANVSTSNSGAVITAAKRTRQSTIAVVATQNWVAISRWRRFRISASAPLGSPSRNTGSVEADCTSATSTGEVVSVVISHAAATSFIHMLRFDANHVSHNVLKTGTRSASHVDGVLPDSECAGSDMARAAYSQRRRGRCVEPGRVQPRRVWLDNGTRPAHPARHVRTGARTGRSTRATHPVYLGRRSPR